MSRSIIPDLKSYEVWFLTGSQDLYGEETLKQVTERIERKLQETPYIDKIRSYSKPGEAMIIFQARDSSPPRRQ